MLFVTQYVDGGGLAFFDQGVTVDGVGNGALLALDLRAVCGWYRI